jgi:hypothetical protein
MDAAALVDPSIPILDISALVEDIKAGSSIAPLSSRELDLCLKGSPSPPLSLPPAGLMPMDRHVYVPEYLPEQGNLRTRVLQAMRDHPTAGHIGYNKTLELLCRDYVWPSMRTDCNKFVSQCGLCAQQTFSPSSSAIFTGPGAPMVLYQDGRSQAVTCVYRLRRCPGGY